MQSEINVLAIDWGSRYVGVAYIKKGQFMAMPMWYIINDWSLYFGLADIIARDQFTKVVVWRPARQKNIQVKIDKFISKLSMTIDPEIEFIKVNEDYSSVESWAITSNFTKHMAEDAVSAMVILERRLAQKSD